MGFSLCGPILQSAGQARVKNLGACVEQDAALASCSSNRCARCSRHARALNQPPSSYTADKKHNDDDPENQTLGQPGIGGRRGFWHGVRIFHSSILAQPSHFALWSPSSRQQRRGGLPCAVVVQRAFQVIVLSRFSFSVASCFEDTSSSVIFHAGRKSDEPTLRTPAEALAERCGG